MVEVEDVLQGGGGRGSVREEVGRVWYRASSADDGSLTDRFFDDEEVQVIVEVVVAVEEGVGGDVRSMFSTCNLKVRCTTVLAACPGAMP